MVASGDDQHADLRQRDRSTGHGDRPCPGSRSGRVAPRRCRSPWCPPCSRMPSAMVEMTSGSTPRRISGSTITVLKTTPSSSSDKRSRAAAPARTAAPNHFIADQREEGRQHDELALREIDGLRGLPEQREADRRQRIDRAGGQAGDQQLEEIGHDCSWKRQTGGTAEPWLRPIPYRDRPRSSRKPLRWTEPHASARISAVQSGGFHLHPSGRPHERRPVFSAEVPSAKKRPEQGYFFSFGSVSVITCLPSFTSPRKLMRSISPVSSHVASIRMPGTLSGVIVSRAAPRRWLCRRACPPSRPPP